MKSTENQEQKPVNPSGSQRLLSSFNNWISFGGLIVVVGSVFAFLLLFAIDTFSGHSNPYMGILTYLGSPAFLVLGLLMMMVGWIIQRRQVAKGTGESALTVVLDPSNPRHRKKMLIFSVSALVFMLLTALGSYRTYHFTESVTFCGEMCHTVMEPEYSTYQRSPHARVGCVDCHIGSGVDWYVKAKISGLRQVYAVLADSYERPIDTPIANLRPAQDTCEQCHWPQKFVGNLDRTYVHYLSDVENSPYFVRMLLKVGGGDPKQGPVGGIHWHTNAENKVEYIAIDDERQEIPWVRVTNKDGEVVIYKTDEFDANPDEFEIRRMDCMDCHNRPAHVYTSPNDAVDQSIFMGRMDRSLEDLKFNVVDLLTLGYDSSEEAMASIEEGLTDYYEDEEDLPSLITEVQRIYKENFFPAMRADWSHYPENLGHKDWLGCFRCHDGNHFNKEDGVSALPVTKNECNSCHLIVAQGDDVSGGLIDLAGLTFEHPGDESDELLCSDCHTGALQ